MHDALAVVGVQALARIGFEDRGACLLELEEQGIVLARHQEHDATEGPDAADADHLDRHVHELETVQKQTPVFLHGFPIAGKGLLDIGAYAPRDPVRASERSGADFP